MSGIMKQSVGYTNGQVCYTVGYIMTNNESETLAATISTVL